MPPQTSASLFSGLPHSNFFTPQRGEVRGGWGDGKKYGAGLKFPERSNASDIQNTVTIVITVVHCQTTFAHPHL